jgi:putative DNA primase/helicase
VARARQDRLDGVGIALTPQMRIVGLDLDGCRDLDTGELAEWAAAIQARFPTLWQVSPSGTGLRGFLRGHIPPHLLDDEKQGRRAGPIEVYQGGRYLTITDVRAPGSLDEITDCQPELEAWLAEIFPPEPEPAPRAAPPAGPVPLDDEELLERMFASKHGDRIRRLWDGDTGAHGGDDNPSSADQALCNHLAFWTDRDEARIDRLFRRSGLYREEKWGRRADYRATTIKKAIAGVVEGYAGPALEVDVEDVAARRNGTGREDGPAAQTAPPGPGGEDEASGGPSGPDGHTLDDVGNAERLLARYGERLRYCEAWHKWLVYDGRRWAEDPASCRIGELAIRVVRRMAKDAAKLLERGDRKGAKRLFGWAATCRSASRIAAMVDTARRFPQVWVSPDELDADPWLLNCPNGTVDLRSARLLPHDPARLLTRLAPVRYDPAAASPAWEGFVADVTATADGRPDPQLADYLQRAIGHSLTGDQSEQAVYFPYGKGANGKSTLLNTIKLALGEYAMQAKDDLLMVKRHEAHPTELADLYRRRLVVSTELEDGRRLAEALVKQMSGGERIRARRMREDFWEFDPTHTVWVAANHKPEIRGTDHAIWRRIRLVPFDGTWYDRAEDVPAGTPVRVKDVALPDRLRAALPAVLAWGVRGTVAWTREGLRVPKRVSDATDAYREEMDTVGEFAAECCLTAPQLSVFSTPLYEAYKDWCAANNEHTLTRRQLAERLRERGFTQHDSTGGRSRWFGLGLRETEGRKAEGVTQK